MFKKGLALMLAVVMLLQPMVASAVTWGEVVTGLQNTGSYSGSGTNATMDADGHVTVTGGIVRDVVINEGGYTFVDVLIDGELFCVTAFAGESANVQLSGDTSVYADDVIVAAEDANVSFAVDDGVQINVFSLYASAYGDGVLNMSNDGSITGGVMGEAQGNGSLTIYNGGELLFFGADAFDQSAVTVENTGDVSGDFGVWAFGEGKIELENYGSAQNVLVYACEDGKVTAVNGALVDNSITFDALDQSNVEIVNNGVANYLYGDAVDNAKVTLVNNGEGQIERETYASAQDVSIYACEDGEVTAVNGALVNNSISVYAHDQSDVEIVNNGIANDLYGEAMDNAKVTLVNNGEVYFLDAVASQQGEVAVENHGQVSLLTNVAYDEGVVSSKNEGEMIQYLADITDNGSATLSGSGETEIVSLYVNAPSAGTFSAEQLKQIIAGIDAPNVEHTLYELWTYVEADGEYIWQSAYRIDEAGNITLLEHFVEAAPHNGPSKEMIKHWMEVKRQEEAIGGVYGSPYWLKQANLGYHSLQMRLFEEGERVLFRQYLNWMYNGTGDKRITLRANDKELTDLTLRIDGKAIETLERTEITTITLVDYNHKPYMEYKVADLKAAREKYGLADTDVLCVGNADAQVMKIGADGKMVPVEEGVETL